MRKYPKLRTIVAFTLLAAFAGCDKIGAMMYLMTPRPHGKTVPAECDKLVGKRVAIVIHADPQMDYEYPGARLGLASLIAAKLRENVKGITVVDPRDVAKYQAENLHWDEMDRVSLAKAFDADYMLFLSLMEYSLREPGSVGLYRGRIKSEVSVYDATLPEMQARVWRGRDVEVTHPDSAAGEVSEDERAIRRQTEDLFVDQLVKNFYEYEVPIEE